MAAPAAARRKFWTSSPANTPRPHFFVIGKNINSAPELVARMVQDEHEVGNHGWSHVPLPRLSAAQIETELTATNQAIAAATGGVIPLVFRPPFGSYSPRVAAIVPYAPSLWNLDSDDWEAPSSAYILQRVSRARPGSVILMHGCVGKSVRALPQIIQRLEAKGLTLVTVSQLLAAR
ncbi:MAG: polysaccharide deacetylase family protein [Rhodobacteraceae bacterium]|nr:polysaccharide deacetylase family protein [Paracoccaceae bacterium]